MDYKTLHRIRLNGIAYSKQDIYNNETPEGLTHFEEVILFLRDWFSDSENIIVKTSGSTGKPKEISIPKQSFVESAKNTCDYLKISNKVNALLCIPVKYIGGKMMVIRALISGYNLIIKEPNSSPLEDLNENIDFIAITPMQAKISLDNSPLKLKEIETVIIGGGNVSDEFCDKISSFSNAIYSTYGMTETVSHIALRRLSGVNKSDFYTVFPSYSISQNRNNCLVINCPTLSKEKIKTNDIVELDGNNFKFIGRIDNVINTGGIKVFPEEIEKKLSSFLIDITFYISSRKDNTLGEKLILVTDNKLIKLEELKNKNHGLNSFSFPKEIVTEKINFTSTGKIIRRKY